MSIVELNEHEELERTKRLRDLTKSFLGLTKPLKGARKVHTLNELILELHTVFNSDSVNIEYVNHLMMAYTSNSNDWKRYAKFDRYRYTRNLIDEGNHRFNLMLLCWGEGHGSAIHDHADSHCFMKVLKGTLSEIKYTWPQNNGNDLISTLEPKLYAGNIGGDNCSDKDQIDEDLEPQLQEIGRTTLKTNDVCYINDTIGLHRVENSDNTETAVSLHLYCPPFDQCSIFNQRTGKSQKANVTFWSKYGQKLINKDIPCIPEDN